MKQELLTAPDEKSEALAVPDQFVSMVERLATNPDVDVAKLEKLLAMQERIIAHNAKTAFDAAFAQMQGEIPIITERGEIVVNGQVRSKYATLEDILRIVRPILQKYGFALRHRNMFLDGKLRVTGILSHRMGHSEEDQFEAKADNSGSKNDIQALGSTQAYGQRYTTRNLLGIASSGEDDDGVAHAKFGQPDVLAPVGFDEWWKGFSDLATRGTAILTEGWNRAKPEYRNHVIRTNRDGWNELKRKAQAVK